MKPGLFVVCEGTDKGGKTSVIRAAMKQLSLESALDGNEASYNKGLGGSTFLGKISSHYPSTSFFLLEQLYQQKKIIEPWLKEGRVILQDRWFYSVITYPAATDAADSTTAPRRLGKIPRLIVPHLKEPDLLVHFTCSLEERIRRLAADPTPAHRHLLEQPAKIIEWEKRQLELYASFPGPKYLLETTAKAVEESSKELVEVVKSVKRESAQTFA